MGTLGDRQFGAARRVRPGRLVSDSDGRAPLVREEFALAVVDEDGRSVNPGDVLTQLLLEQRQTNRLLGLVLQQLGGLWLEDGLSTAA